MAKSKADIVRVRKLQFPAGQAKPGPALAGVGINMPEFTRAFNDATRDRGSEPVPVQITVYNDKSFDFKLFTAPASYKLKQAAKINKGSSNSKTTIAATITKEQLREIAEYKLPDLNTDDVETAMSIIAGTAKNMGILIEGYDNIKAAKKAAADAQKAQQIADAKMAALDAAVTEMVETKGQAIDVKTVGDEEVAEGEE
ncbi:50S ribosomal protein L11 [Mycoplasma tauri]|uniref:Large ribosomal subunit protein uL11 n=1 Tax=Mycoplasma tauri TaxID=547987 RepID=A0A953T749_9MOLU|nr:50S ribosomal protein L11 [Mycoplasma tauri]MBZ4195287.1 50S ribosomal protein L11 [Mycoplasma tauri]MBZ4203709.1 50S ribosomal protein L11 [Mycoplasma tauri]MBZ4204337.1 50S ribosomal protein L11 [Mycoplasma tauri]MBZ4218352.1 50S ribosomal protein L11 [Mycoplasma tauri]MBZ4226603.1 50S ribosomal protein L11 [Mycoplasma tauri]